MIGTWLYRFLIFAVLLTFTEDNMLVTETYNCHQATPYLGTDREKYTR